tara:strand:+ start:1977 stop:2180 length:204 start_codon:yes stop_codon:yes gene_type:complete
MGKNRNSGRNSSQRAQLRAQAGLDRKHFYENGGEMCRWRGLKLVQEDKVKKANKNACRRKVKVRDWC